MRIEYPGLPNRGYPAALKYTLLAFELILSRFFKKTGMECIRPEQKVECIRPGIEFIRLEIEFIRPGVEFIRRALWFSLVQLGLLSSLSGIIRVHPAPYLVYPVCEGIRRGG